VIRVATIVLVLAMSGLPAAAVVCHSLCDSWHRPQQMTCHGSGDSAPRSRRSAPAHDCDHLEASAPFVAPSNPLRMLPLASSADLPLFAVDVARAAQLTGSEAARPPGIRSLHSAPPTLSLRI
jgi:hypothetical protein